MQEMIDEADRDGDGEVNLEEFERIMRVSPTFFRFALTVSWSLLKCF